MKQFTNAQYAEAKVAGKELGINFVGKKKEDFIALVNQALAAKQAPATPKASLEDYNLAEGQVVTIAGRTDMEKLILAGRQVQVVRASKPGFIKAQLIGKDGKVQKTEISLPVAVIIINNEVAAA